MSTVQRLGNVFANIFVFLFVSIVSTSVILLFSTDVGFMELKDIWSTFLHPSLPSPPPSSLRTALDNLKVSACVTLLILTLLAFLYIRNIYGRRFTPDCYQSLNQCVAEVRLSLLLQHNEGLANGLQKMTAEVQKATADLRMEQAMSKFHREMVQGACQKYVELKTASAEALRRSNNELDESKQNVARLNTLVDNLRQDIKLSQANVRRLEHSAKEYERGMEVADQNQRKAIVKARHAQAEANALRSEARLELDAMRVGIDLVRRDLGASKRRAKVARNEAQASHMESISLRSALAESRKEVSTVRKGVNDALETLKTELKEQKADNEKLNRLLATYNGGTPATTSPPLTPPGSVTPPEEAKFATTGDSRATSFPKSRRSRLGLRLW